MPYRLRGYLSLPAEGDGLPLVLLLHGAHDAKDPEAGFYRGFAYLADALARRGYAAVSLDIQPAYVHSYGGESDDRKACAWPWGSWSASAAPSGAKPSSPWT